MVLILDCWSVHKSSEFKLWLVETHPEICLIFVPTNCTSELQPTDVILQRPFKPAFQQHYSKWYVEQIEIALSVGIDSINLKLDFSIGRMRKVAIEGLLHAHSQLLMRRKMIVGGWEQCMLLETWSSSSQMEAFKSFYDGNLFGASSSGEVEKVEPVEVDRNDEEWYAIDVHT
ncbi:hypothetical protein R1flu_003676 [Riccia fluitans]|uniref:DDE-1 domain-containing protein n=1 Tax=Riccia fluitans TaxID=41844 RepID=A0ABD1Y9Q6_9MARC